ncbi:Acireductone dioxygenase ARD family [Cantharellus anzutake]|uniref:Acireductone dioxygenase ARD family n=1 Tax=Cantharellus anzutake TaxID=1750568 RepID=UPI001908CD94|nr:Acireductone dioxygenase ARD family [Cantharellus anzutake]KAF8335359.1 Acireductone dioxygenase ARD family [Cantharellus anzutake]
MKAYWFNEESFAQNPDQKLAHAYSPDRPVTLETLRISGVLYWSVSPQNWEPEIDRIAAENGYKNRDVINVTKEGLGDLYEAKLKIFFEEHLHEDEEIRFILSGSGFFDVRELKSDAWIRIHVIPGDLLVLPAGIYHRFTLDEFNAVKALRLFKDEPRWIAYNRSGDTDINPFRVKYIQEANR